MALTREDIIAFSLQPREVAAIEVPRLGTLHVRALNAREQERHINNNTNNPNSDDSVARLIALSACDPTGKHLLFTDMDVPNIANLPVFVIEPIVAKINEISRMGNQAVDDAVKNSEIASSPSTP